MSLTKSSPAYERWAEEQREDLEHSYEEYLESLYLSRQRFPADDEQLEHKPAERHNSTKR
jgi:hypothetical protein